MAMSAGLSAGLGAGASLIPSIFGLVSGIGQRRQAKRLRQKAVDPGYEMNSGVLQNADILRNRYGNYQMPGFNQALNNINASSATAFNNGVQGASSSSDVLDLATRIAYGTGRQQRDLQTQNAMGQEGALMDFLQANQLAGNERQNQNEYERQRYQDQLAEAAALYNAGSQNINSGIQGASSIATSALFNPTQSSRNRRGAPIANAKFAGVTPTTGFPGTNPLIPFPTGY